MSRGVVDVTRQVALLLLSIDRKVAAELLRNLPRSRVEDLLRAMKELEGEPIDEFAVEAAFAEFERRVADGRLPLGDVAVEAELVLHAAFGEADAREIRERVDAQLRARRPFRELESLDPRDLARLCEDENPQVAAMLLAHLAPARGARVLELLPEAVRPEIVARIARLGQAPPAAVERVVRTMLQRVEELGLRATAKAPDSWLSAASEILVSMPRSGDVLDAITESDEELGKRIRAAMFVFEDVGRLDRSSMQALLGEVDPRTLAMALKAAPGDVERNVFENLSRRAAAMVAEERELLGPTPLRDVRAAQETVLEALHGLVEQGQVRVGDPTEPMV
ncbi:MAG: hypothetical protein IT457_01740 [Planctomycetes bacterium]|nr:hypothetical protein [Planctomycetota bacterium]